MRRAPWALLLALPLSAADMDGRMQAVAAAYRAGHYFDALWAAADILEEQPENLSAKNYVWTITRKIQKEKDVKPLSSGEMDRALSLARRSLEERRRRTQEILALLRAADARTRSSRSPRDLLDGMGGLDKFFDKDLSAEMADEQARVYKDAILDNLSGALQKGIFVSRKDHLRAEGYLAYFQGEWPRARDLWRQALALDPAEARLKKDLESLEAVLNRRDAQEKVQDLARQARIHFKVGEYGRAAETWREVLALDPGNAEAKAELAVARVAAEKTGRRARLKERTDEGLRLYRQGDAFSAAEVWLEVLQEDPTYEEARTWLQHAGRKIGAGAPAAAPPRAASAPRKAASGAPARSPERALELYKEGVVQYAQDNVARSIELWKEALALDPGLARAQEALRQAQAELALQ